MGLNLCESRKAVLIGQCRYAIVAWRRLGMGSGQSDFSPESDSSQVTWASFCFLKKYGCRCHTRCFITTYIYTVYIIANLHKDRAEYLQV